MSRSLRLQLLRQSLPQGHMMLTISLTRKNHGRLSGLSQRDTRALITAAVSQRAIGRSAWFEFDGTYFVSEADVDSFVVFAAKVLGKARLMEPGQPTRTLSHPEPWGLEKVTPTLPTTSVPAWVWAPDTDAERLLGHFSMAVSARVLAARRAVERGVLSKGDALDHLAEVMAR